MRQPPVTIVMPTKNAATTVIKAIKSIEKQSYPVSKIIVIDNVSTDTSVARVHEYAKKSTIPIQIIVHKKNYGVSTSFNTGVKKSRTELVILMHSDSYLPGKNEIEKLLKPLITDSAIVSTGPILLHPRTLWKTYNFWLKLLFTRVVDTQIRSGNGKFDGIKKSVFLSVGGFDDTNYGHNIGVGGEDGDLHVRLSKRGKIRVTNARVVHLHYLNDDYTLSDFIVNRKLLARSYGRLIRMQSWSVGWGGLRFLIKPVLCLVPFVMWYMPITGIFFLAYLIWYPWNMYADSQTRSDVRIVTVPFIMSYLVYAETYWMFTTLFTDSIDEIA